MLAVSLRLSRVIFATQVLEDSEFAFMGDDFMWVHTKLGVVWRANSSVVRIVDPGADGRIAYVIAS